MTVYDRQAEAVRRKAVDLDMRQGWVLVEYFYDQLGMMAKDGVSLKDNIGPMVYRHGCGPRDATVPSRSLFCRRAQAAISRSAKPLPTRRLR